MLLMTVIIVLTHRPFFSHNNEAEYRLLSGWPLALEWATFGTASVP